MSTPSSGSSGQSGVADVETDRVGQLFDLVSYVVVLVALFVAVSAVGALAVGSPVAPGVKFGLFVFGWLALFAGTMMLRPTSAWKDDDENGLLAFGEDASGDPETGFQRVVQRVPPARFRQLPPSGRLPTGARVFVGALAMLLVSLAMEQVFGVGP
jgi:hypothetical protein